MTKETMNETAPETTPQSELERVHAGETKSFDAPALCALLCQLLAHPDYWNSDGYLMHMEFHRDEVRTIANFMSIGIGADRTGESFRGTAGEPSVQLGEIADTLIRTGEPFDADSAMLGEFVAETEIVETVPAVSVEPA